MLSVMALQACSNFGFPGVYRIDIKQGNIIEEEQVSQLKPGMTKSQVLYVMGTPMVTDTFHQKRWDYYYSFKPGEGKTRQKHLTLLFKGDLLEIIKAHDGSESKPADGSELEPAEGSQSKPAEGSE